MPEVEKTGMREPEPESMTSYDRLVRMQERFIERQFNTKLVLQAEDREWEQNRQGRLKYYLLASLTPDTTLQDFKVLTHDVRRHSGKHVHQGGLIIYVLEGKGWSVVDGERVDWKKGDMVILPLKPGGVEHQHFNADPDKGCRWLAIIYYPFQNHLATEITQREEAPRE